MYDSIVASLNTLSRAFHHYCLLMFTCCVCSVDQNAIFKDRIGRGHFNHRHICVCDAVSGFEIKLCCLNCLNLPADYNLIKSWSLDLDFSNFNVVKYIVSIIFSTHNMLCQTEIFYKL